MKMSHLSNRINDLTYCKVYENTVQQKRNESVTAMCF